MKTLRHGDWTFTPTKKKVKGTEKHKGSYTWAEGEATGHFHTLKVKEPQDMVWHKMPDGSYLVELKSEGIATHPEHSNVTDLIVPAGTYHLKQRREKDWFSLETRRVID